MNTDTFTKLLASAKSGDFNAYNRLCVYFFDYVPEILKSVQSTFGDTKIDPDDLHQEGYCAVCMALRKLINSPHQYTIEQVSDFVTQSILLGLQTYMITEKKNREHVSYNSAHLGKLMMDSISYVDEMIQYEELRNKILKLYNSRTVSLPKTYYTGHPSNTCENTILAFKILPENPKEALSQQDIANMLGVSINRSEKIEDTTMRRLRIILGCEFNNDLNNL